MRKLFISGIGTDVGKTVVSSIVVEKLKADYWKPIQAGDLELTDTMKVRQLVSNSKTVFHKEAYKFTNSVSPHYAAALDRITIDPKNIYLPISDNDTLVIEGAGGLMVPLNENYLIIDLIKDIEAEIILVSNNYLGSINHTLLSIEAIQTRNLPLIGIIFNGISNPETERIIQMHTGIRCLGQIPNNPEVNKEFVLKCTSLLTI
jgi:dethiobiotin synthetase